MHAILTLRTLALFNTLSNLLRKFTVPVWPGARQEDPVSVVRKLTGSVSSRTGVDVGGRLKAARVARDMSQRELASHAGVTNGMISMIEQNKHSPSVATLNRLTDALGLSFAEFFSIELPEAREIFYDKKDLVKLTEGRVTFRVVAGERRDKAIQVLHEVYEPGGDTGEEMLTHAGEEGGIVVEGEIELTVGEETRLLGPGDAYYFKSTTPHRFRNPGKKRSVVISACTPPFL